MNRGSCSRPATNWKGRGRGPRGTGQSRHPAGAAGKGRNRPPAWPPRLRAARDSRRSTHSCDSSARAYVRTRGFEERRRRSVGGGLTPPMGPAGDRPVIGGVGESPMSCAAWGRCTGTVRARGLSIGERSVCDEWHSPCRGGGRAHPRVRLRAPRTRARPSVIGWPRVATPADSRGSWIARSATTCRAARSPAGSRGFGARPATWTGSCRFHVRVAGFVQVVAGAAWSSARRTWSIACCRRSRFASGC